MAYRLNKSLPKKVKDALPSGAETIYRKAFNNAEKQYKSPKKRRGKSSFAETINRVAWSAVKKQYKKKNGKWVKK